MIQVEANIYRVYFVKMQYYLMHKYQVSFCDVHPPYLYYFSAYCATSSQ